MNKLQYCKRVKPLIDPQREAIMRLSHGGAPIQTKKHFFSLQRKVKGTGEARPESNLVTFSTDPDKMTGWR